MADLINIGLAMAAAVKLATALRKARNCPVKAEPDCRDADHPDWL